jgi:hypothetical protein
LQLPAGLEIAAKVTVGTIFQAAVVPAADIRRNSRAF